jgi:hypothetical protein
MRMPLAGLVLVGIAAAGPSEARAYVRTMTGDGRPLYWNRTEVPVLVYAAQPPPPLTPAKLVDIVNAGAASWSRKDTGCTALHLLVGSKAAARAPVAADGVNRLMLRSDRWCPGDATTVDDCYDPFILAMTTVTRRLSTGEILDADVEINAVDYRWGDVVEDGGKSDDLNDLQSTVTHELGHLIGLAHTCSLDGAPPALDDRGRPVPSCDAVPEEQETTMFPLILPGATGARTLSHDELRAACDIYPALDPSLEAQPLGCSLGGRGSAGPWVSALLAVASSFALRRIKGIHTRHRARDRYPPEV